MQWVEDLAEYVKADAVVCLGDFFDKDTLTGEELTALNEVRWASMPHNFVVGNHEISAADLSISSQHVLALGERFVVHDHPLSVQVGSKQLCFLPYQAEENIKSLAEYFPEPLPRIVFSHNNIKGVQMGHFLSDVGLDLTDVTNNSWLFFNGHIHNAGCLASHVWNVGNLTGQNFSEDAERYEHVVVVIDTETGAVTPYRNPHALNFYKIDCSNEPNIPIRLAQITQPNAVVSVRVREADRQQVQELLKVHINVLEYRVTVVPEVAAVADTRREEFSKVDYLAEFQSFIQETLGATEDVVAELKEICR